MLSTNTFAFAVCVHEAGYRWAARRFKIKLRPTRLDRGLRRYAGDVINTDADDEAPETLETMAQVMLIGGQALSLLAPDYRSGGNDEVEARSLLWDALELRHGQGSVKQIPSLLREFNIRIGQLQEEAQNLVAENREKIAQIADKLLAAMAVDLTANA
jgi:hypothetical protein